MKIFISSLISGVEPFRAAAREAVLSLGHEPVMAEDLGARPTSPQIACLRGLRESAAFILILCASYGAKQASGLSATHEEYREAKDRRPVLAFVQEGVTRDPDQAAFLKEVQAWDSGLFRSGFCTPEQLRTQITRRLHEWELATAVGPVDEQKLLDRVLSLIPTEPRGVHRSGHALTLAVAGAPRQPILRPSDLDRAEFQEEVQQAALFGARRIFTPSKPTTIDIENHALVVSHGDGDGGVRLTAEGDIVLGLPLARESHGMVIIEESVAHTIAAGLRYAVWLLDRIDATQRLTHAALAATISGGHMVVWRTQREQDTSPDSFSMGMGADEHAPVHFSPPHRPRAALAHNADQLVEDLVTLLRREWRGR